MKIQDRQGRFVFYSLVAHLVAIWVFSYFWKAPLDVVDSQLKPEPLLLTPISVPEDVLPQPPAEIPDTTKPTVAKAPKAKKESKDSASKDTLQLAFDTSGNCSECLAQPPFPDPEFYKDLGVDSSWAEILVKIDTSGQVVEVYDQSYVEEGIKSQSRNSRGLTKLYDETIQKGANFWANTYEVAEKWNFYKAARHADPKISKSELMRRYPPGKWILQRVNFKNPL